MSVTFRSESKQLTRMKIFSGAVAIRAFGLLGLVGSETQNLMLPAVLLLLMAFRTAFSPLRSFVLWNSLLRAIIISRSGSEAWLGASSRDIIVCKMKHILQLVPHPPPDSRVLKVREALEQSVLL